jgi:chemotaxis signal transduction protein
MSRPGALAGPVEDRVAELRAEFDSAFTRRLAPEGGELTDVLTLRIGDDSGVLRLSDLAEVIAHPVLTPVPTSVPALIGLAAGRGYPIGVFDLGLLLGRGPVEPRWLVRAAAAPVGLVFEHFDGYHRISLDSAESPPLISMSTLIDAITRLAPCRTNPQEIES